MAFRSYRLDLYAKVIVTLPFNLPPLFKAGHAFPLTLPVTSFQSNFELNAIPNCTLTLPLGRQAENENNFFGVSVVHWVTNFLNLMTPLEVYAKVQPLDVADVRPDKWPAGFFKIFDGYCTATGYRKEMGSVEFQMSGLHWLSDLDFSSPFSEVSHAMNPAQFTFKANLPILGINAGGNVALTANSIAKGFFDIPNLKKDLWASGQQVKLAGGAKGAKGGLKYWLEALAGQKRFNEGQIRAVFNGFVPEDGTNSNMLKALARFEPINGVYKYGKPLSLNLPPAAEAVAADAIVKHIGRQTVDSFMGVTMWDKLINQFATDYMFNIVPMVDRAVVIPAMPFYRGIWQKIAQHEYHYIEIGNPKKRPIRGVGIMSGRSTVAGGDGGGRLAPFLGLDGYYQGRRNGMVIITTGPSWMTNISGPSPIDTAAPAKPKANGFAPNAAGDAGNNVFNTLFLGSRQLCNIYAEARYLQEVLRGNQGILSGKLRFDIAPGSLVEIEGSAEPFVKNLIGNLNAAEQKIYGQVMRVTTLLDAGQKRAGTSLHIAYVRNLSEQNNNAFTRPGPGPDSPSLIYVTDSTTVTTGTPLVDHPAFVPQLSTNSSDSTGSSSGGTSTSTLTGSSGSTSPGGSLGAGIIVDETGFANQMQIGAGAVATP